MGPRNGEGSRYRRATLKDVAAEAGVNISTVSKVLNSKSQISVRPETRERIVAAAKLLRYHPDPVARNLRYGRGELLAMFFPDLTNPVYGLIMRGASQRAEELGYTVLVAELGDADVSSSYERLVGAHRIDGLVIAMSRDNRDQIERLALEAPHVYVNRRAPGSSPSVVVDDEAAGRMAAETLLAAGHSRLGFIGDADTTDTARRRRLGFFSACERAGAPRPVDVVAPYTRAGGYEAMTGLLDSAEPPTAVFASSLLVGIGSLAAARNRGVAVPEELSLLTLDAEDADYTAPPLSAIRLPLRELGAAGVDMIDAVLGGEPPSDQIIPIAPELIERESVAPPAKDGARGRERRAAP